MTAIEVDQGELRSAAVAVGHALDGVDPTVPSCGTGVGRVDDALSAFAGCWTSAATVWSASLQSLARALAEAADSYDAADTAVPELP